MARKKQLTSLVAQLRAETGRSQKVSVGVDELDNLKEVLRRTQETLYESYHWPHLGVDRTISLSAGQRYYDFPSDLNFDRISTIKLKYNGTYVGLDRDITFDDYSIFDSNADTPERSFPCLKWDVRYTGTTEQFEIWPIPSEAATVYIHGTKELDDLIDETDRAELDDRLIVLFAAAEMLARQKSPDAQAKLAAANQRLQVLRANSQAASPMIQIGLGNKQSNRTDRYRTRIIVS